GVAEGGWPCFPGGEPARRSAPGGQGPSSCRSARAGVRHEPQPGTLMNCHQCGGPPVGACRACGKFYCAEHGRGVCLACFEERRPIAVAGLAVLAVLLPVCGLFFLTMRSVNPEATKLGGIAFLGIGVVTAIRARRLASRRFP